MFYFVPKKRNTREYMELRSKILGQFEIGKLGPNWCIFQPIGIRINKRKSPIVSSVFNRENLSVLYSRCRSLEVHCNNDSSTRHSALKGESSKLSELLFNRLQLPDEECQELQKRSFGRFNAREAVLDEEYWTAAWLRAEAHWEPMPYMRHIDSHKRKFAEQEFYALKRRCSGLDGNSLKCFCFVAVKKEEKNVRRTVLNSVVGTLDLSVRQFLKGETYPGEVKRLSPVLASPEPFNAHKYAYIANVCVAKFARRQGIASNMLYLASDVAASQGMGQMYVHVNADNNAAQELYRKVGFKMVPVASSPLSRGQMLLMSTEL